MRQLSSEEIQKVLETAVENIMQRDGVTRKEAMKMVEEKGVAVRVRIGEEERTLLIKFPDKPAPFKMND